MQGWLDDKRRQFILNFIDDDRWLILFNGLLVTIIDRHSPVKIKDDVVSVSAGLSHTIAIKTDGSLWAWGWNSSGQLGDETIIARLEPVRIIAGD